MSEPSFTDQTGAVLRLNCFPPQKIISLVPSQTELLISLGLKERIAGITRFCIHPQKEVKELSKIGGTKNVDLRKIISINPDLIIANKEENSREQVETLKKGFPVWVSDVYDLSSALTMIRLVGELTGTVSHADAIARQITDRFLLIKEASGKKRVLYLIWQKPWMAAGKDTFIANMLSRCGFENCCTGMRYPTLNDHDIRSMAPEVIFLSSEPYPFREKHRSEMQQVFSGSEVVLVNGEYFSWYGSRLLAAPAYFRQLQKELQ